MDYKKLQLHTLELVEKALVLSRVALRQSQLNNLEELNLTLSNRERVINILLSHSENLSLYKDHEQEENVAFNTQLDQKLNEINKVDQIIVDFLQHQKSLTQVEIAQTFKNKESFKGYNLNKVNR